MSETLLEVRTDFINESGRHDLVVDATSGDYSDNGADVIINAGIKFLVLRYPHSRNNPVQRVTQAIGSHVIELPLLRSVEKVYYINTDGAKVAIGKVFDPHELIAVLNITDNSAPTQWTHNIYNLSPGQESSTDISAFDGTELLSTTEDFSAENILINPAPDVEMTIQVYGQFFSRTLSVDADKNVWTVQYPRLVVEAAQYRLEQTYKNETGMRTWERAIRTELLGVEQDRIDRELGDTVMTMPG